MGLLITINRCESFKNAETFVQILICSFNFNHTFWFHIYIYIYIYTYHGVLKSRPDKTDQTSWTRNQRGHSYDLIVGSHMLLKQ
jgi:hypothetical protein